MKTEGTGYKRTGNGHATRKGRLWDTDGKVMEGGSAGKEWMESFNGEGVEMEGEEREGAEGREEKGRVRKDEERSWRAQRGNGE